MVNKIMSRQDLLDSSRKSIDSMSSLPSHIACLVERLQSASSSVNINLKPTNMRLLQLGKGIRVQEDPVTKLRNIENKSEIRRAEHELLTQRKPKSYSIRTARSRGDQRESYLSIYRRMRGQDKGQGRMESEMSEEDKEVRQGPRGISHYQYLKQHPKLIQFTLNRVRGKDPASKNIDAKEEARSNLKKHSQGQDQSQETTEGLSHNHSNKELAENQLSKFYTKSSKGKLDVRVKDNPRCNKLLERQQRIVSGAESASVSKDNMKKLKERLNEIVNEIGKSQKKGNLAPGIDKLPKINPFDEPF